MKQFAYLFFILAFQVLLIGSCISGGIGNSLSKPSLTSYYVDLNLLNQPASLKNNVFNQSCWWKSRWHQCPTSTHLNILRDLIEAFSNPQRTICFWLSCFPIAILMTCTPTATCAQFISFKKSTFPTATSSLHFFRLQNNRLWSRRPPLLFARRFSILLST